MSRMPTVYPHGTPFYWMNEESGELRRAIEAYLDNRLAAVTDAQIVLLRDYLVHYINAPCWKCEGLELERLRFTAQRLDSPEKISEWIQAALEIGLDPF